MRSILQWVIFDNKLQDYLIFAVAILLLLLLNKYVSRSIATFSFRLLSKTSWSTDKEVFVRLVRGPIHIFIFLLVSFLCIDRLNFPKALDFRIHKILFRDIAEAFANAVLIIAFIWLLLRLIDFIATVLENKADASHGISGYQLVYFFRDFFKVVIVFIGILLLIRFSLRKDIAPLLAGFGIVGAAVALSARESLENLIASFIIIFDKPFYVGDVVKVQNITGTVERIGLRSTRIRTDQKTYVTVPNKQMVDTIIDNLSLRTQRKGNITLELSASASFDAINQVVAGLNALMDSRRDLIESFSVVLSEITRNSFLVQTEYFTGAVAMDQFNALKQQLNFAVIELLEEKKVKLAGKETEIIMSAMKEQ